MVSLGVHEHCEQRAIVGASYKAVPAESEV